MRKGERGMSMQEITEFLDNKIEKNENILETFEKEKLDLFYNIYLDEGRKNLKNMSCHIYGIEKFKKHKVVILYIKNRHFKPNLFIKFILNC